MEDLKHWFLFGKIVDTYFEEEGFEETFALAKKQNNWKIFMYDERLNEPHEMLDAYIGWDRYAMITEDEYNQLSALKNEKSI